METKTMQEVLKENKERYRNFLLEEIKRNKQQQRKEKIIIGATIIVMITMLFIMFGLCCRQQINTIKEEQMQVINNG